MEPEASKKAFGRSKTECESVLSRIIRPSQLKQEYLTTFCSGLDKFLSGGIPTFGITELSGESATGKTQLCLQLSLAVQLPTSLGGLNGEVVYINTEKHFPSQRLVELTQHFTEIYDDLLPDAPMDKVNLEHVSDTESLLQCLQTRLPNSMRERIGRIRLIILDSVAALFRADYAKTEMEKRTEDIRRVGVALHNLSRDYNVAIFVVNQVTGSFAKNAQGGNVPSLGLTWANLVTTRLILARTKDGRSLSVKFAPHIPNGSIPIQLDIAGIRAAAVV